MPWRGAFSVIWEGTFDNKNINKISKVYKYKPWGKKSNPLTAVKKFLKDNKNFVNNEEPFKKALVSNCYSGFLKKIKYGKSTFRYSVFGI